MKPLPARLELRNVSKSFGGVHALSNVSMDVRPGEILGLVGENGAGKSTLIKIVTGSVRADRGSIYLDGQPVRLRHACDAQQAGIAVVHQEAELFPHLSLAENMLMGSGLPQYWRLINWRATYAKAESAIERLGESFAVRDPAGNMTVARRMLAGIAAAVNQQARLLFLDEPTASLTSSEVDRLFEQIRRLAAEGVSVVYVSHRLQEIQQLCQRVTILRDGKVMTTEDVSALTTQQIVTHMVGREITQIFPKNSRTIGEEVLRLKDVTDTGGRFHNLSLQVHRGEIVGLYGLVGAGRTEVAEAIFGLRPLASGDVFLHGESIRHARPASILRQGAAVLPEDRLVHGIFAQLSLSLNAAIAVLRHWFGWTWVKRPQVERETNAIFDKLHVKFQSLEQSIGSLSGGNQQKVLFARWLMTEPDLMVVDEPTRGIDIQAKAELHGLLDQLACSGKAILMISSDLPEAMGMSDRLLVMRRGRIVDEFEPDTVTEEQVAHAALPDETQPQAESNAKYQGPSQVVQRLRKFSMVAALVVMAGLLAFAEPEKFASWKNLQDIADAAAIPFLLSLGATLVIASGGIDISVGSMLALCAALCGMAINQGWPVSCAILVAVLSGSLLGSLNALLSIVGRVHAIIVTLATLGIYRGLMRVITAEKRIEGFPEHFRVLTEGYWLGVRPLIWYSLVIVCLGTLFLRYTRTGRSLLAVGDSPRAALMIGLSRGKLQWLSFSLCGALTGLAGAFWASSYGIVDTYTAEGWELKAIAAAVIGGCLITGGTGTAWGAAVGALLMELIRNGLVILGVSAYWEGFYVGLLILAVVCVDKRLRGTVT